MSHKASKLQVNHLINIVLTHIIIANLFDFFFIAVVVYSVIFWISPNSLRKPS